MSQPISCGIQREQSHYWLMRRRGIEAFILITVMCVCKRAPCTCFSLPPNIIFIFLLFFCSSSELRMNPRSQGGKLIFGFRFISMIIIRSCLHLPLCCCRAETWRRTKPQSASELLLTMQTWLLINFSPGVTVRQLHLRISPVWFRPLTSHHLQNKQAKFVLFQFEIQ